HAGLVGSRVLAGSMPRGADEVEDAALRERAATLTALRTAAAERLETAVTEELHALFMPDASFHVGLTPVAGDGLGPYGAEDVTLALRPHAGVEPRPLGRGASGGELS
ncbi:DNA repair protein RecN, partial [Xanthomonas citri pv. citri]|nr:DNA repair protein RecN [Xanthomonas citri pv. citri]